MKWTMKSANRWVKANIGTNARVFEETHSNPRYVMRRGHQHYVRREYKKYVAVILTNGDQDGPKKYLYSAFRLGNVMRHLAHVVTVREVL